jgi:hypothetical protein
MKPALRSCLAVGSGWAFVGCHDSEPLSEVQDDMLPMQGIEGCRLPATARCTFVV